MRRWLPVALLLVAVTAADAYELYHRTVRNKWLGQPITAQGVTPATGGWDPSTTREGKRNLAQAVAQNRGTGSAGVAIVALLADTSWEAGQWTEGTTTYTVDTTDAQDVDTNDFALETTTANSGFVIGCDVPCGAVSLDTTTASVGGTPVRVLEYWNGAWTTIAAAGLIVGPTTSGHWATGENIILFSPPNDWVVGGTGTNVNAARYNFRVRATTAPSTTAALARRVYVGVVLHGLDAVAANGNISMDWRPGFFVPGYMVRIGAAFQTADEGNALTLVVE